MRNYPSVVSFPFSSYIFFFPFFFLLFLHGSKLTIAVGTVDGSEEWGYVQVRPKAHMFWWLYRSPHRVQNTSSPWPVVLWLQGGPGSSGVGIGNFEEIGPLDSDLKPRNSTWLQKADLLFVDNPVGTGYSFVEDIDLLVKSDQEAASDLTYLLKKLFNGNRELQKSPLYIFAESYGGKYAVTLGLSVVKAIRTRKLKLKLGGVALGDSWISPEDFVLSWGPLLADLSRLDKNGFERTNSMALQIQKQIRNEQFRDATNSWRKLQETIDRSSNYVDFYNFLLDSDMDTASSTSVDYDTMPSVKKYSTYLSEKSSSGGGLSGLLNGVVREKLKIIPKNISWGGQAGSVFNALSSEFMKPRVNEVDELLAEGINVTIYNGQLDLICSTKGTEAWIQKLKWDGLMNFTNQIRTPLYCRGSSGTKGFTKSHRNLRFYWILGAGHFVPVDQPCIALKMLGEITQSPRSVLV